MQIERILNNPVTILMSEINAGKTMLLSNMIVDYTSQFSGELWTYGIRSEITDQLPVTPFYSLLEMERIKNSIIIVDEVRDLFDLNNRKKVDMVEQTMRMLAHNNNRLVLAGLPHNFKKFISEQASCFMFKNLTIKSLINGSFGAEVLSMFSGELDGIVKGTYVLSAPKDRVLCWDMNGFWAEEVVYFPEFDTKKNNQDLFKEK